MISFLIARQGSDPSAASAQIVAGVSDALLGLAEEVAEDARTRVLDQRDPARPLPSALADSIQAVKDGMQAVVYTDAPYAIYVELGTRRQPARPFLGPAAERLRGRMGERITASLRRLLAGIGI